MSDPSATISSSSGSWPPPAHAFFVARVAGTFSVLPIRSMYFCWAIWSTFDKVQYSTRPDGQVEEHEGEDHRHEQHHLRLAGIAHHRRHLLLDEHGHAHQDRQHVRGIVAARSQIQKSMPKSRPKQMNGAFCISTETESAT